MKKLILKKEVVSSLSNASMSRLMGGGESNLPSAISSAPCRCDLTETDNSEACITNPNNGCSMDCTVVSIGCVATRACNLESTAPQYCDLPCTEV